MQFAGGTLPYEIMPHHRKGNLEGNPQLNVLSLLEGGGVYMSELSFLEEWGGGGLLYNSFACSFSSSFWLLG